MRRKKRYGVYSNKTIRRCGCSHEICDICKSVCKVCYDKAVVDPKSVAENHPKMRSKKIKLHKIGVGSLLPGKKFAYYNEFRHGARKFSPWNPPNSRKRRLENYGEGWRQVDEMDLENKLFWSIKKER